VGAYGIYYSIDEVDRTVTVLTIVDQRRDPNVRLALLELD